MEILQEDQANETGDEYDIVPHEIPDLICWVNSFYERKL